MTLACITIRAPWTFPIVEAQALAALDVVPKLTENRSQRVNVKYVDTDMGIHAGLTWCTVGEHDERVRRAWWMFSNAIGRHPNPELAAVGDMRTGMPNGRLGAHAKQSLWIHRGAVLAVATLADCHPVQPDSASPTGVCCPPWGEFLHNGKRAWHLVLADVRRLPKPVPAAGKQLVPWTAPEGVETAVRTQLAKAGAR